MPKDPMGRGAPRTVMPASWQALLDAYDLSVEQFSETLLGVSGRTFRRWYTGRATVPYTACLVLNELARAKGLPKIL